MIQASPLTPPIGRKPPGIVSVAFTTLLVVFIGTVAVYRTLIFSPPDANAIRLPDHFALVEPLTKWDRKSAYVEDMQDRVYGMVAIDRKRDSSEQLRLNYELNNGELVMQARVTSGDGYITLTFVDPKQQPVATATFYDAAAEVKVTSSTGRVIALGTFDLGNGAMTLRMPEGPVLGDVSFNSEKSRWDVSITNVSRLPLPAYALIAGYNMLYRSAPKVVPDKCGKPTCP